MGESFLLLDISTLVEPHEADNTDEAQFQAAYDRYDNKLKMNDQARAILLKHLGSAHIAAVKGMSFIDSWQTLKIQCTNDGAYSQEALEKKLNARYLKPNEKVQDYIDAQQEDIAKYNAIADGPYTPYQMLIKITNGLTQKYAGAVSATHNWWRQNPTPSVSHAIAILKENCLQITSMRPDNDVSSPPSNFNTTVPFSTPRGGGRGNPSPRGGYQNQYQNQSHIICYKCNKPGHKASDCRSNGYQNHYTHDSVRQALFCNYCKKNGHTIDQCFTTPKNQAHHNGFTNDYDPTVSGPSLYADNMTYNTQLQNKPARGRPFSRGNFRGSPRGQSSFRGNPRGKLPYHNQYHNNPYDQQHSRQTTYNNDHNASSSHFTGLTLTDNFEDLFTSTPSSTSVFHSSAPSFDPIEEDSDDIFENVQDLSLISVTQSSHFNFVDEHQTLSGIQSDLITNERNSIIIDSGATAHMFNDAIWFANYKEVEQFNIGTSKPGATLICKGIGDIILTLASVNNQPPVTLKLSNVLHAPSIARNLLSVASSLTHNLSFQFDSVTGCKILLPIPMSLALLLIRKTLPFITSSIND